MQCVHATHCQGSFYPVCHWRRWCGIHSWCQMQRHFPTHLPYLSLVSSFLRGTFLVLIVCSVTLVGATSGVPETGAALSAGGFSNYFGTASWRELQPLSVIIFLSQRVLCRGGRRCWVLENTRHRVLGQIQQDWTCLPRCCRTRRRRPGVRRWEN